MVPDLQHCCSGPLAPGSVSRDPTPTTTQPPGSLPASCPHNTLKSSIFGAQTICLLVVRGKQRLHEIIKTSNAFISNYLVYKYLNFAYDMPATGTCNSQILPSKQQGLTGITYAPKGPHKFCICPTRALPSSLLQMALSLLLCLLLDLIRTFLQPPLSTWQQTM